MATPSDLRSTEYRARRVIDAKWVKLALVSYTNESGQIVTQPVLVGDNTVHLLDGRDYGFLQGTPKGAASSWLRSGIQEALGRPSAPVPDAPAKAKKSRRAA